MASLKNVHHCTFFSFEFFWWKTRYCLEPLTSCQYSDVTVICNVPVANYLASFTKIKFLWNVVSDLSARRPWRYWAKTRLQCAQGWAWDRSETSFGTKLVLNRCTWTYIGWEVHGCTTVEDGSNGLTVSIFLRFFSILPDAFTFFSEKCAKFYFLKMQQLNKIWILETVAFVREKRTHQYASFRKKTWRLRWAASL